MLNMWAGCCFVMVVELMSRTGCVKRNCLDFDRCWFFCLEKQRVSDRTGPNRRLAGILRCRRPLSFKLRPANVSSCFLWSTMASVSIPACTGALLLDIEGTTTPITFVKVNLWLGSSLRGRAGYGYANGCLNTMKTTDFFFYYYVLSSFYFYIRLW